MIYELKISLLDTKPEIWRQVLIPVILLFTGCTR